MESFDGKNKSWSYKSEIKNFIRIEEFPFTKSVNLCNLNIIQQIGTPSTMAQVFKVKIDETLVLAAKILPICNDDSFKNNEKEMKYAVRASELKSIHFPKVYDIDRIGNPKLPILCNDTHYNFVNSNKEINFKYNWETKSLNYQQNKFLLEIFKDNSNKLNKFLKMKKNFIPLDVIVNELDKKIILPTNITSHIIFSEILPYDLKYLLVYKRKQLSVSQWYIFIKHLLSAIYEMHFKLNIFHADLHLGNILVYKLDNNYIPVIHDFGKSLDYDKNKYLHRYNDISSIISHIEDNSDIIPVKILKLLDELTDVFNDNVDTQEFPIINLVKFWNNVIIEK